MDKLSNKQVGLKAAFLAASAGAYLGTEMLQSKIGSGDLVFQGAKFVQYYMSSFAGALYYSNYLNFIGSHFGDGVRSKYASEFNAAALFAGLTLYEAVSPLMLTNYFDWGDMAAYTVAIGIGYLADKLIDNADIFKPKPLHSGINP